MDKKFKLSTGYDIRLEDISDVSPVTTIMTDSILGEKCFMYKIFFKNGNHIKVYSSVWKIKLLSDKPKSPEKMGYIQQEFYDEYKKLLEAWKTQ